MGVSVLFSQYPESNQYPIRAEVRHEEAIGCGTRNVHDWMITVVMRHRRLRCLTRMLAYSVYRFGIH